MSPSPLSPSRSSGHKSRKKGNRTRSLSSVSGNEQSNGNKNAQLGEETSPSIAQPIQPTHLPKDVPLPPSPTGTSTSIPSVGEPSPDQGANKKQETKHDQLAKDGSEGRDDKVQRVRVEAERTGWARLYDLVGEFDKNRISDNKEDIDTLLVFAGLFSAVVTAFIIESYRSLQQQPEDLTNHILMQLAVQISHLSINGHSVNSTVPDFTTPPFQKPRVVVVINSLWILSLLIALITASLGILVKQWFHELLSYETHDPMERLKLRFFREAGVERWKVFAIASALPLLLQLALLFFFIGLTLFFHQMDPIVAWLTTVTEILWLGSLLFATFAPTFSSQCPYKTPFLKEPISRFRVKLISMSWPGDLAYWLGNKTSRERFHKLKSWFYDLYGRFADKQWAWKSLEEGEVSKDGSLNLPVISFARDLLQGERLRDSIIRCIRDISADDMEKTAEQIGKRSSAMNRVMLPTTSHGPAGAVGSFTLEVAQDDQLRSMYFGQEIHMATLVTLYFGLSHFQSKTCTPGAFVIPPHSTPAFIHLIQANQTSAAFSLLTMYSIRSLTLTEHPDSFNRLFPDSGKLCRGIGDQYMSNLLTATRLLIHSIWDQPQHESDDRTIGEYVKAIRANADQSDPVRSPDPIAFINVFARVLRCLVPLGVVLSRKDEIYELMGELAGIIEEEDGLSWSYSRKRCVEYTYAHFQRMALDDLNLGPKLRMLVDTWSSEF